MWDQTLKDGGTLHVSKDSFAVMQVKKAEHLAAGLDELHELTKSDSWKPWKPVSLLKSGPTFVQTFTRERKRRK